MAQDRLGGDEVPLTHEFLSLMLGIHREGVTVALNVLKRNGFIRLMRGCIQIADRRGLIRAANGSYGIPEPRPDEIAWTARAHLGLVQRRQESANHANP